MKRSMLFFGFYYCLSVHGMGQSYKLRSLARDMFSVQLIYLLNKAPGQFDGIKGTYTATSLMGEQQFRLSIPFPGSSGVQLCYRDERNKSIYIEYRFANKKDLVLAALKMIQRIRNVLGHQLHEFGTEIQNGRDSIFWSKSFGIRDNEGYFSDNLFLYTSNIGKNSIMTAKDQRTRYAGKPYYLTIKIEGGKPDYAHYIRKTEANDNKLTQTIKYLLTSASADFTRILPDSSEDLAGKGMKINFIKNDLMITINDRSQNHFASLSFDVSEDSVDTKWSGYMRDIETAVGNSYVYSSDSDNPQLVNYYKQHNNENTPSVYLQKEKQRDHTVISIVVMSGYTHQVKRSRQY